MTEIAESDFSPAVVEQMWARAFASCERCGRGLDRKWRGFAWSAHHRRPRGSGGSGDAMLGLASNGLVLCGHGTSGCHGWVERNRLEAAADGLLVGPGDDPVDVPVYLYFFGLARLLADGNVGNP